MSESKAGTCAVCRNEYHAPIQVAVDGKVYDFDCFECAIHALAPTCEECGVRVLGHGFEVKGRIFCSGQCARRAGFPGAFDRLISGGDLAAGL